ncbi:hypothetical protein MNEG_6550 [Monoraphidium neglectum]|uniref:Uncharacterized protein n=1 Tax=Monoraphidium neglectum TaxID=145388 RepID=A0A0D2JQN5_9CHLO|nr:hypothetical protein MNEG_6550 [Monoraphidium neglectum]KIZ01408.1 hypothetical protein MNEG_6550 [Monoraphidium neglectum]|eukprot:XP_013900427.1 hypothetical protein MNEG_6550 [Monoraphidium neglectum]
MVWAHAALAEEAADAIEEDEDEGRNDAGASGRPRAARGSAAAAAAAAPRGPSAAAVSDLVARRGAFVRALEAILDAPAPAAVDDVIDGGQAANAKREWEELRDQAFCGLVDLAAFSNGPGLAQVAGAGLAVSAATAGRLWGHVEALLDEEEEEEEQEDGGDGWEDGDEDAGARRAPAAAAARRSAAVRLAARRAQCTALLGRLLLAGCLPRDQDEWLGARLVGLLADGTHPQVQEVARGVCRELRRHRPGFLPHLYLSALKTAWEQVEDSSDPEGAMGPFEGLAAAVSSMYNGVCRRGQGLF